MSQVLANKNLGMSIYEKELLSLIVAVTKWRHYLMGAHFVIKTDHESLKYLLDQRITTPLQQKWLSKLMGMDYEIQYKKGRDTIVAVALSRRGENEQNELNAISVVTPAWLQEVTQSYNGDAKAKELLRNLSTTRDSLTDYTYDHGIIRFKGRIFVGDATDLRRKLMECMHDSLVGGHFGNSGTSHRMKLYFYWPGMKRDVEQMVQACDTCKKSKAESGKYLGLLQPLLIPEQAWQHISLDFIEGLPKSKGHDTIMAVIDRFTKYGHFISLTSNDTAQDVAQLFFNHVYKLHGLPLSIFLDRDKVFTSAFWQDLFLKVGTELCLPSAYHPQSDG